MVRAEAQHTDGLTRRALLGAGLAATSSLMLSSGTSGPALANQLLSSEWEGVSEQK